MKTAKLILLASPILVASTLLTATQAKASIVKPFPTQSHLAFASDRSDSESVTPNSSKESNPIIDKMGCQCSNCSKAQQDLQGKLPFK